MRRHLQQENAVLIVELDVDVDQLVLGVNAADRKCRLGRLTDGA